MGLIILKSQYNELWNGGIMSGEAGKINRESVLGSGLPTASLQGKDGIIRVQIIDANGITATVVNLSKLIKTLDERALNALIDQSVTERNTRRGSGYN